MWNVAASTILVGNYIKPGGALLYSTEDMAIRTLTTESDPWAYGRWASQRYQRRGGNSLLVISAYRVGKRTDIPGSSTAWHQQKVLLMQANRSEEPEDAFLNDMVEWIKSKQNQNNNMEIVLFLNANEK